MKDKLSNKSFENRRAKPARISTHRYGNKKEMIKIIKKITIISSPILLSFLFLQPSCFSATEHIKIIEGKILDVHILGQQEEKVLICHFDPRYVVVLKTVNGIQRLAIHSPARTFFDDKPIGNSYKFIIEKDEKIFKIKSINKINP